MRRFRCVQFFFLTEIHVATFFLPGSTNREHRKLIGVKTIDIFGYKLQLLPCGVLPVCQNLSYKLQIRLADLEPPSNKLVKSDSKRFPRYSYRTVIRRQVMRHFTTKSTDHCQNGLYREQPPSTWLLSPNHGQRSQQQSGQITL